MTTSPILESSPASRRVRTTASRQTSAVVDVALVAAGVTAAVSFDPLIGAPIAVVGLILPIARRLGPRSLDAAVLDTLPDELLEAHEGVIEAAADAGDRGPTTIAAADRLVTEAAAVLAGRPTPGRTHTAFVSARVAVLESMAEELEDRRSALAAARRELDGLDVAFESTVSEPTTGLVVRLMVGVLLPLTLAIDVVRAIIRLPWTIAVGVVFRLRTAARLIAVVGDRVRPIVAEARMRLRRFRTRIAADVRAARLRTRVIRMRVRDQLRSARR